MEESKRASDCHKLLNLTPSSLVVKAEKEHIFGSYGSF